MISFAVDASTRADAVELMHVLHGFHPWTVELARQQWVVVGRVEQPEDADDAFALVSQWAAENHVEPPACRAGEDEILLRSADGTTWQ